MLSITSEDKSKITFTLKLQRRIYKKQEMIAI